MKIGLTGNIGSGKSFIANIWTRLGIAVYNADKEAKNILAENDEAKQKIRKTFGEEAYLQNGQLDRKHIANIVFSKPEMLEKLNTIVHPIVINEFKKWHKEQNSNYVIFEAAILFESKADIEMDYTICVSAPTELRIKRVAERDNIPLEEIQKRIQNQYPEEELIRRADYHIINDEKSMLLPQIISIHKSLCGKI